MRERGNGVAFLIALCLSGLVCGLLFLPGLSARPVDGSDLIFTDEEAWAKAARASGSGIVRMQGPDGDLKREMVVDQRLRLSADGLSMLEKVLEGQISDLAAEIDKIQDEPEVSLDSYRRTLEGLLQLETRRAMRELLANGAFLILRNGEDNPPTSSEVNAVSISPFHLVSGEYGRVLFLVRRTERPVLQAAHTALQDVLQEGRAERIRSWNAQPDDLRRAWVEDYFALSERVKVAGYSALNSEDLRRFVDRRTELHYLGVAVTRDSWTMTPK
jgi:hypothetical protein